MTSYQWECCCSVNPIWLASLAQNFDKDFESTAARWVMAELSPAGGDPVWSEISSNDITLDTGSDVTSPRRISIGIAPGQNKRPHCAWASDRKIYYAALDDDYVWQESVLRDETVEPCIEQHFHAEDVMLAVGQDGSDHIIYEDEIDRLLYYGVRRDVEFTWEPMNTWAEGSPFYGPLNKNIKLTKHDEVTDGGFELGGGSWAALGEANYTIDNVTFKTGEASLKITGDDTTAAGKVAQGIQPVYDEPYTFSAWLKCTGLAEDWSGSVVVEFFDDTGIPIGSETVGSVTGTTDWTFLTTQVTVPEDTIRTRVCCVLDKDELSVNTNDGTVWFDDVKFWKENQVVASWDTVAGTIGQLWIARKEQIEVTCDVDRNRFACLNNKGLQFNNAWYSLFGNFYGDGGGVVPGNQYFVSEIFGDGSFNVAETLGGTPITIDNDANDLGNIFEWWKLEKVENLIPRDGWHTSHIGAFAMEIDSNGIIYFLFQPDNAFDGDPDIQENSLVLLAVNGSSIVRTIIFDSEALGEELEIHSEFIGLSPGLVIDSNDNVFISVFGEYHPEDDPWESGAYYGPVNGSWTKEYIYQIVNTYPPSDPTNQRWRNNLVMNTDDKPWVSWTEWYEMPYYQPPTQKIILYTKPDTTWVKRTIAPPSGPPPAIMYDSIGEYPVIAISREL